MTAMVATLATAVTLTVSSGVPWRDAWAADVAEQGALSVDLMGQFRVFYDDHRVSVLSASGHGEGGYTVASWESLIQIYFDAEDWPWARRVMGCESGGNPDAVNPTSGASGLFQFLPSTWSWASEAAGWGGSSPFDPPANVAAAAWLHEAIGPSQWACKG